MDARTAEVAIIGPTPGLYFEDLAVGLEARVARLVTTEDIRLFAELSGDFNPIVIFCLFKPIINRT